MQPPTPDHVISRADRLLAIVTALAPATAAAYAETAGTWPGGTAPYVIDTPPDGMTRVRITTTDGDVLAGRGPDLDAALAMLEQKAGLR